jgi:hypothetical protein
MQEHEITTFSFLRNLMAKTEAEKWLKKIDCRAKATPSSISRDAVELMQDDAVNVLQGASGRYTDVFVFKDGSGLYEKRKDDWYHMDAEEVKQTQGEDDEEDEKAQAAGY